MLRKAIATTTRRRLLHTTPRTLSSADFTHVIIGAGVVGLAVGKELSQRASNRVLIIEKHDTFGQETSSRNSEVIHAGLYYPPDSLKTRFCIEGKNQLYALNKQYPDLIKLNQCGKWLVAQTPKQFETLEKMHGKAESLDIPTRFVSLSEGLAKEPLICAKHGILESSSTGIVDSHSLMNWLISQIESQEGEGEIIYGTEVVGLKYDQHDELYEISTVDVDGEDVSISCNNVINCAGLGATAIYNMLVPTRPRKTYFSKGNYFGLVGVGNLHINRLVYPVPEADNVKSLGTHLTIDLAGQVKFGPDLEWIDQVEYKVNDNNLEKALVEISKYLPVVKNKEQLVGVYSGIRPKLIGPEEGKFQDFEIVQEPELKGFVSLLGIESPGLTSSLGLAKYVNKLVG